MSENNEIIPALEDNAVVENKTEVVVAKSMAENSKESSENSTFIESKPEAKVQEGKASKNSKKAKKEEVATKKTSKKKDKKQKKEFKLGRRFKETASELKKVTWPKFPAVIKKTGIVLAFVLIVGVVLFGIDRLLSFLLGLLAG